MQVGVALSSSFRLSRGDEFEYSSAHSRSIRLPSSAPSSRKIALVAALLCVAAVALHAPVQGHPWVWDDETQIADNPAVSAGVPLAAYFLDANTTTTRSDYNHGIYRPLRTLSYRALALAFGVRPAPFEAANLIFYAVLTALVLLLLLAATGDLFAAGTASALFVVLPVHVQPVAYASALGDLESAVLELAALFCGVAAARARGRRQLGLGAASLLLAAAAMFAKEMAVTEPLLLVLALWLSGHLRRDAPRFVAVIVAAHLALAAGYVVLRSLVLGHVAQLPLTPSVLAEGLRKAPVLLVEYAKLTLMPLGHRAFYLVRVGWSAFALALGVIAVCALAAVRLRRPAFTVGLVGFALALLPVLQLLPITTDLADRFALLPSVGLALAAAALLAGLPPPRRALAGMLAGATALALLGGTLIDQRMWQSDLALWRYTVDREPDIGVAHANLANVLLKADRPAEALLELDRARALGVDSPFMWVRRARALDEIGRREEAIAMLRAALKETPTSGQLHAVLGDLYRRTGRIDAAARELDLAERYAPGQPVTVNLRLRLEAR